MPGQKIVVERPDILIVEGLNVLQPATYERGSSSGPFVSDFIDFSIFIDAEPALIERWYVERFMRLRSTAFRDPASFFHRYVTLTHDNAVARALELWRTINLKNLVDNILPTRPRARLILQGAGPQHQDCCAAKPLIRFDRRLCNRERFSAHNRI